MLDPTLRQKRYASGEVDMNTAIGSAARRELAVVLGLAAFGVALVLLVAFAPWYEPVMLSSPGVSIIETIPPVDPVSRPAEGVTLLVEGR